MEIPPYFGAPDLQAATLIKDQLAPGKNLDDKILEPAAEAGRIPQLLVTAARLRFEDDAAAFQQDEVSRGVVEKLAAVNAGANRRLRAARSLSVPDKDFEAAIENAVKMLLSKVRTQ